MGVLDKYQIRSPRGRAASRSSFNPGRNANWDWNELLKTIENNFEGDFDLTALEAKVDANVADIATQTARITVNESAIAANVLEIAANTLAVQKICVALNAAFEQAPLAESASATAFNTSSGNPCIE